MTRRGAWRGGSKASAPETRPQTGRRVPGSGAQNARGLAGRPRRGRAAKPSEGHGGEGGPPRASGAPPPERNKGAKRVSRQEPRRPRQGPGSRSRPPPPGFLISAPKPRPSDRPERSRFPFPPALTRPRGPKPLRSSSRQAAGRARAGRGPRVARKPPVEPGKAATGNAAPRPAPSSAGPG